MRPPAGLSALAVVLARAVGPEAWMEQARCRMGYDPDRLFFAEPRSDNQSSGRVMDAKRICGRCEVRRECLMFALDHKDSRAWGVYGGSTEAERARMGHDPEALLVLHSTQVAHQLRALATAEVREQAAAYEAAKRAAMRGEEVA